MRAPRDHHADGHQGRIFAHWRGAAVVVGAAALALTAGTMPAWAAGGYTVTATIGVGQGPDAVAVDPAAGTVYVTNPDSNTVSVIDMATNTVKATINLPMASEPDAVAVDPAAGTAYVANHDPDNGGSISVIDTATSSVTGTIRLAHHPDGVAADPGSRTLYVDYGDSNTVSVIDTATKTVKATITVASDTYSIVADPAARTVYVANSDNTVSVIDTATKTVKATIPVGSGPGSMAVDPAAGTVYVGNEGANTVSVIDTATNTVKATITVASDAGPVVAADPAAGIVYAATSSTDGSPGVMAVIDAATSTVTTTFPTSPEPSGVAVDLGTHTLYVTDDGADTVSVIRPPRPTPAITVTSSHNPSVFGQKVTFTATAAPVNGGTITFRSGSKVLCRAVALTKISGSKYHATCTTSTLRAGRDTITAAYPGDTSYATASDTLAQTVTRAPAR
jgi:YVTN family beta-propeller protein